MSHDTCILTLMGGPSGQRVSQIVSHFIHIFLSNIYLGIRIDINHSGLVSEILYILNDVDGPQILQKFLLT